MHKQINSTQIGEWGVAASGSALAASLTPVVIYSTLIELMPLAVPILADRAKWDNPKYTRMHKVVGFYSGYAIGLLVLGISELGLLLMWIETEPYADGSTYNASSSGFATRLLYRLGRQPDALSYACGQDQLGSKFLQQAIIGFTTPKVPELKRFPCSPSPHLALLRLTLLPSPPLPLA